MESESFTILSTILWVLKYNYLLHLHCSLDRDILTKSYPMCQPKLVHVFWFCECKVTNKNQNRDKNIKFFTKTVNLLIICYLYITIRMLILRHQIYIFAFSVYFHLFDFFLPLPKTMDRKAINNPVLFAIKGTKVFFFWQLCLLKFSLILNPLQVRCKSLATPIQLPFYERELERFRSEFEAKVKRSHNGGKEISFQINQKNPFPF